MRKDLKKLGTSVQSNLDSQMSSNVIDNSISSISILNNFRDNKRVSMGFTTFNISVPNDSYLFLLSYFKDEELILDFLDEIIQHGIYNIRYAGDSVIEEITFSKESYNKLIAMHCYYESTNQNGILYSLDDLMLLLVDKLYDLNKEVYDKYKKYLLNILGED